ncbi:MAG: type VI secretion system tube protein Hcp [Woeseiaceae bacterium]|nr:type VI secretion system tube protein Hcp [Woeseiaceae bacterium]
MNLKNFLRTAAAMILACGATTANAAIFLQVPGVAGESTAKDYKDWIIVQAMSIGVIQRACTGVQLAKPLDRSSPALSAAAITGQLFPSMTMAVTSSTGDGSLEYLNLVLTNVVVSSVQVGATASGPPSEQVSLLPGVITMVYRQQLGDGRLGSPVESTFTCAKYK